MAVCGIIAEYNPFHNGHKYMLDKSKKSTDSEHAIVVMSGNYVQRGEPAIVDKYYRTKMALENGASIVLELPLHFAVSSAQNFAIGAISILHNSNICDFLCFGSESKDEKKLNMISEITFNESEKYKIQLKQALGNGFSYPKAMEIAINGVLGESILIKSNDILGIEYLNGLKHFESDIKPVLIKRKSSEYNQKNLSGEFSSATAIRKSMLSADFDNLSEYIPENVKINLEDWISNKHNFNELNNFSNILAYVLRKHNNESLTKIVGITEGIENRIFSNLESLTSIDNFIKSVATKRYTTTRLQRLALSIILNITKVESQQIASGGFAQYIRVLGFRKDAQQLVGQLTKKANLPIVTNLKNSGEIVSAFGQKLLQKEIQSTDVFFLGLGKNYKKNIEYAKPLVIV